MESTLAARLLGIRNRLAAAARRAGRADADIRLIAVSKGHSQAEVEAMITAGQSCFGENRVQEAEAKFAALQQRNELELHLIGPLQSNKAKQAVLLFDVIHTVDRPSLIEALAKAMQATGRKPRLFVEVNIGREPQKAGVLPEALEPLLRLAGERGLHIEGLMAIPPADQPPEPCFRELAAHARQHGLRELSMGMSADFESAIACGATYIRVGTALFGSRI